MSKDDSALKELSSQERIDLVQGDGIRRWGQLIISFLLVGSMLGYLFWYAFTHANQEFLLELANAMQVLLIMALGAALAIFGLGRTVGRK